jgi:hypothetical protein
MKGFNMAKTATKKTKKNDKNPKNQSKTDGITDRFVPGKTRCKTCGYPMMVNGTGQKTTDDGDIVITRFMKCLGPDNHKYPLKELIKTSKIEDETVKKEEKTQDH